MPQFQDFVDKMPDFFKPWGEEILLRYFDFDGVTGKATFWKVVLINIIISVAFGILTRLPIVGFLFAIVSGLYSLATLIPGLALAVRRLRDTGKDWYFLFFGLIPCVGWIILLVFYLQDSVYDQYN